ncbi:MAG: hypothetical protein ACI8QD_001797, partial [Cyclobacteriaceae bacterium]
MKAFRLIGMISFTLLHSYSTFAQEIDLESFVEQNFDLQYQSINYEDIYESLFIYHTRPLNLNTATEDELTNLYLLNRTQIVSLIAYRVNSGPLLSVHELQVIAGFDPSTIKKIMPFVTCSKTL